MMPPDHRPSMILFFVFSIGKPPISVYPKVCKYLCDTERDVFGTDAGTLVEVSTDTYSYSSGLKESAEMASLSAPGKLRPPIVTKAVCRVEVVYFLVLYFLIDPIDYIFYISCD